MLRLALLASLGACSFSGGSGGSGDSPDASTATVDASVESVDARVGEVPFGEPQLVAELHTLVGDQDRINYDDPTISASGELFMSVSDFDNKVATIYRAQRKPDGSFDPPEIVPELDADLTTSTLWVSANGLELYFGRVNPDELMDIFVATRASESDPWGVAQPLQPGSGSSVNLVDAIEGVGQVSRDGLRIYFASDRGVDLDLYVATRTSTALPFDNVTKLAVSADDVLEISPKLTDDELTLYYGRRPVGASGFNTYISTRTSVGEPFTVGVPLSLISSANEDDTDFTINPDDTEAFFASTRATGTIRERIYRVNRE